MSSQYLTWSVLPQELLVELFSHLDVRSLGRAACVCRSWQEAGHDNILWRARFAEDFGLCRGPCQCQGTPHVPTEPLDDDRLCWRSEYELLVDTVPRFETDHLKDHGDEVLHVACSHNGVHFATCSKDGHVLLWNSGHPATIRYRRDMHSFSWNYTQFSEFNADDTLLLVSGVHIGDPSVSGEIAVFSIEEDFQLRCRINNKPYDIFGAWFSRLYVVSGELRWLSREYSESRLWLNRAHQESDSEHTAVVQPAYRFFNPTAHGYCRMLRVARFSGRAAAADDDGVGQSTAAGGGGGDEPCVTGCDRSGDARVDDSRGHECSGGADVVERDTRRSGARPTARSSRVLGGSVSGDDVSSDSRSPSRSDDQQDSSDEGEDVCKYLIFTSGSSTYTPHQIGLKCVTSLRIRHRIDPGPSLRERVDAHRRAEQLLQERAAAGQLQQPDWQAARPLFDAPDQEVDLHGQIIGMCLSPSQRYLYVNVRAWPRDYHIDDPLSPPPIAQQVEVRVLDVAEGRLVGRPYRAHRAFTANDGCFFLFVDVSGAFVASGAEDRRGYLWSRRHGVCLSTYPHEGVVNAVSFGPRDSGLLVSASDDHTVKVWRSRRACRQLGISWQLLDRAPWHHQPDKRRPWCLRRTD